MFGRILRINYDSHRFGKVVSVVEGGILMGGYRRNLAITVYGFPWNLTSSNDYWNFG
jgi:hypothetical protein